MPLTLLWLLALLPGLAFSVWVTWLTWREIDAWGWPDDPLSRAQQRTVRRPEPQTQRRAGSWPPVAQAGRCLYCQRV